jgi:glycosyltransferase involved in cell wall biosynthesis
VEISLLLSTYQRPTNLRRTLISIAEQEGVQGRFELIVTDDGSCDETGALVASFARDVDFPVRFVTHPHEGFRLARCRNEGVAASRSPYLLFLDGDLVLPPTHIFEHLRHRTAGVVMAGDYYYLDSRVSATIDEAAIERGEFESWPSRHERRRLAAKHVKSYFYPLFRLHNRPRLTGGNIGMWRVDFERVNGYDQNFVGWGFEDRDLQYRLSRSGVRFRSSLGWTRTYHLWHPPDPSFVRNGIGTSNRRYFFRPGRLLKPRNGLRWRGVEEVAIQVSMPTEHQNLAAQLLQGRFRQCQVKPEVEIVFTPGEGRFSNNAQCNLLVVLAQKPPAKLLRQAHIVVGDPQCGTPADKRLFPLSQFEQALAAIV